MWTKSKISLSFLLGHGEIGPPTEPLLPHAEPVPVRSGNVADGSRHGADGRDRSQKPDL